MARLPSKGTNESAIMIATKATTIPIHTHGEAANKRQPSVHHASPLPAATLAGARATPSADEPKPLPADSVRGGIGSAMEISPVRVSALR